MKKLIHNVATGEIVEVPLSAKELKENAELQLQLETEQAQAEAKAQAKAAAEGKLAALGLTTDDLRALGL